MELKFKPREALSRAKLWQRIDELEAEVQECRQLNLRIAELADVVVELLVPLADSDDPRVAAVIERYRASLNDPAAPRQP